MKEYSLSVNKRQQTLKKDSLQSIFKKSFFRFYLHLTLTAEYQQVKVCR